jgi:glycosyltransferase involved in cell wall biosynthesis
MLEYLAPRYQLDAVHFHLAGDPDPLAAYPPHRFARVLRIALPRHSKAFLPRALRNTVRAIRNTPPLVERFAGAEHAIAAFLQGHNYALAWCEHFWTAPYAPVLRPHAQRLVLDLHNLESAYFATAAAQGKAPLRWLYRRFERASLAAERLWLPAFDTVLAPSASEQTAALAHNSRSAIVPNAIPAYSPPATAPGESIAFSGNFAYAPNLSGMAWFAKNVWPQIFLAHSTVRLRVIGREAELVRPLFSRLERVDIAGPVESAVEELAKSKIAIAPLLFGSGTRLKILEAWAAGCAVVSTTLGAEGLGAIPGQHFISADSPDEFARAILDLFANEEQRLALRRAARSLLHARFTWSSAHKLLAELGL